MSSPVSSSLKVIDLVDAFDAKLLHQFYKDVLVPCFGGNSDELESLEIMETQLTSGNDEPEASHRLHIVVIQDTTSGQVLAGMSFEYYKRSNCGLIAYMATNPLVDTRGMNLAMQLVGHCMVISIQESKACGFKGCRAVFVESNSDDAENDVMNPARRRSILAKMGVRYLDFEYVMPHFKSGKPKCRHMHLGVGQQYCNEKDGVKGLPSKVVAAFLTDYYEAAMGAGAADTDEDAKRQLQWLAVNPFVKAT